MVIDGSDMDREEFRRVNAEYLARLSKERTRAREKARKEVGDLSVYRTGLSRKKAE